MMAKKKQIQLPFVVAPRREPITEVLGSDESGKIEIIRRGYLTVAEKSFMQQATAGDETVSNLHRLAGKVSREKGIQAQEVVQILSSGDLANEALVGFDEDVDNLIQSMSVFEERRKAVAASCMIYFRISQDWTVDQTMGLHPDLIDALYLLFLQEDAKSTEGFDREEEESGETEGK